MNEPAAASIAWNSSRQPSARAHSRRVDKVNPDTEADAYEKRDLAFHWKLRDAFRDIARAEPERCVVIDAAQEERAVFAAVWQAVQSRLLAPPR